MALTGNRDTRDVVVMTGVDATKLVQWQTQSGQTYEQIIALASAGLAGVVNEAMAHPVYSSLISITDQPTVKYRMGANGAMEAFSEYGEGAMQRAETDGHMLPLRAYDRNTGWTWRYLEKAVPDDIQADLTAALNSVRDRIRIAILTRCLKRTDDSGAINDLGTAGYSPGFATTAGSTNVDFVPPSVGGVDFANTHEHYGAVAGSSGAITSTQLKAMRKNLREHGHAEPYELLISADDQDVYTALSGWIPAVDAQVMQYASTTSLARVTLQDGYIGYFEGFRVRVTDGMPRYWHFGYKTYGSMSPLNPLVLRVPKGKTGIDLRLLAKNASATDPLRNLSLFVEFGVGVKDRTAGVVYYTNNGTWADGTPT